MPGWQRIACTNINRSQNALLVEDRITHGRDEIAVIKLHIYAGKRLKWMTSIKLLAITSHLSSAWNMELYSKISATGVCSLKDKLKLHRTLQQFTI